MSKTQIQIAYESDDPNVHTMDVEQLAPSLLAIGNLCKRVNAIANGDKATVRVLVESDFENKCFLINLQIVQDIYSHVQSLLHNQEVKTAKEILEWLGLLEGVLGGFGLFEYLKEKKGRSIESFETSDKDGTIKLKFEGDNNSITITQNVYQLSQDHTVIAAAKSVLQPTQTHGISSVDFKEKGRTITSISKSEATEIITKEIPLALTSESQLAPQIIDARLIIYAPVFNQGSKVWRFIYSDRIIQVDISDSGIAEDLLRRGGLQIGDAYFVKLEITEIQTEKGKFRNHYRAISFSQFLPAQKGTQLFFPEFNNGPEE